MTAREALNAALLDAAEAGARIPCRGRRRDWWTSDDPEERDAAAASCLAQPCPVLDVCRDAGAGEVWAVWGGVDVSPHRKVRT